MVVDMRDDIGSFSFRVALYILECAIDYVIWIMFLFILNGVGNCKL